ncbi:MAG: hormogonium polysaccharide biosynthesis glycosyltransferase HpsE [Microcoleaceae cyanobacterium]
MDFSIVIATYNGAQRLPKVLELLKTQVLTQKIQWEILVIDNNSQDNTAQVVSNYAQKWHEGSQLRYIFEPKQGAAYARCRGVKEAKTTSLIGFLDDDNLPPANWVTEAYTFGRDRPEVGAYGGIIHAKLDTPRPPYFNQVKGYLTIYNRGGQAFQYKRDAKPRRIPPAPGAVIRKEVWQQTIPSPEKLLIGGRDAKTMAAGEDAEMMFYIQNSDWEVWHNPKMEVWHHIPPYRLEKSYLLKLARGYGLSNYLTRLARYKPWQRPLIRLITPLYTIRDSVKLLKYYWQYKNILEDDFGKACELEVKIGQFYSPYLWLYSFLYSH